MTDFLLELRSEEIPARMQARARADLERLFAEKIAGDGLVAESIETFATPRRLVLIARGLPDETAPTSVETKGPKVGAPQQAIDGFLRRYQLKLADLEERDGVYFAVRLTPSQPTAAILGEASRRAVFDFPWPKSMRWGDASQSTESLRWVRPLHGIVALFGDQVVPFDIDGIQSGATTLGHRFHHPGAITIGSAADYVEKLRACHVLVDQDERAAIIREGAQKLAAEAGLDLIEDEGLVAENAGLTEWPVPLLGRFDEAFLAVPPEVIQLTARVNQKYFVCRGADGALANAFICVANIAAADGGGKIVEGNRKVLAARLADAKFFYETDLKIPLDAQAKKLADIVFHEKLGTLADKVERVAKLARWLVEERIVGGSSPSTDTIPVIPAKVGIQYHDASKEALPSASLDSRLRGNDEERKELAALAERAARLAKADLVTGMVGEFPELQGVMGGYYAAAQDEDPRVTAAIRDHYKPVGQGDEVPTDPVTVAVSLADKLDTVLAFLSIDLPPSGSKDPFALRRALLGILAVLNQNVIRVSWSMLVERWVASACQVMTGEFDRSREQNDWVAARNHELELLFKTLVNGKFEIIRNDVTARIRSMIQNAGDVGPKEWLDKLNRGSEDSWASLKEQNLTLALDRLKVQQREAGVRHDLIDAVFALGGEDDLVRLLARVKALQAFVGTEDGANLLTGYRRAANILKKEGWDRPEPQPDRHPGRDPGSRSPSDEEEAGPRLGGRGDAEKGATGKALSYTPEKEEAALIAALDSAAPAAAEAVAREDFEGAMAALAALRAPIDAFFEHVTVNDADPEKRAARLALLARIREAVHGVADFSKIEG